MKPEDQVCSLELAKKLKELGVKQESLFYWVKEFASDDYYLCYQPKSFRTEEYEECYSAFTVMELGIFLPQSIMPDGIYYRLDIFKEKICWFVAYVESYMEPPLIIFMNMKEANVRAQALIHLIENKLFTLPYPHKPTQNHTETIST